MLDPRMDEEIWPDTECGSNFTMFFLKDPDGLKNDFKLQVTKGSAGDLSDCGNDCGTEGNPPGPFFRDQSPQSPRTTRLPHHSYPSLTCAPSTPTSSDPTLPPLQSPSQVQAQY